MDVDRRRLWWTADRRGRHCDPLCRCTTAVERKRSGKTTEPAGHRYPNYDAYHDAHIDTDTDANSGTHADFHSDTYTNADANANAAAWRRTHRLHP